MALGRPPLKDPKLFCIFTNVKGQFGLEILFTEYRQGISAGTSLGGGSIPQ